MKISIIIPVLREEKNIETTLNKIEKNVFSSHEILILLDNKKDPTYAVSLQYKKRKHKKYIRLISSNVEKIDVMSKLKAGFKKAKGNSIVILMADLSDDISQIDTMYDLFAKGYDIVCASRYMKGGKKIGGPIIKTLLSKGASLSLYYFLHVPTHDATNAFKLYNRSIFKKIKVESVGGFEYSMEIVMKAYRKGFKITEIPTVWKDRVAGSSNFKILSWIPEYIKWYFRAFSRQI